MSTNLRWDNKRKARTWGEGGSSGISKGSDKEKIPPVKEVWRFLKKLIYTGYTKVDHSNQAHDSTTLMLIGAILFRIPRL